jgi:hypothetical protein
MQPQLRTMMRDAISSVLETMFFLVPAYDESESLESFQREPFFLESSIIIAGEAQQLRFLFRVTRDFASTITANFLGVGQEEVAAEEMEDTLKELANMVGGACLARLPSDNWRLGIPTLDQPKIDPDDDLGPNTYTIILFLDEQPMAVIHLYVDQ